MARKLGKNGADSPAKKQKDRVAETVVEVVRANVTEATKGEFLDKCRLSHSEFEDKRKEMQQAQAAYRADLKAAAKAGVSSKAIAETIAISKREPEEVGREFAALNEMLRIAKIPIGVQLGLFADGKSIGDKVDADQVARQAPATADDIEVAKEKGYIAGKAGKPVESNPYPDDGSLEHLAWIGRHRDAQAENLSTLGRGPVQGAAAH
jgi:ribosome modulation factor